MYDVIGIDMPCVDLNIVLPKMPEPNGAMKVEQLSWQGGGKVSSGLVTAARLGIKCAIQCAVGDDRYGAFCVEDFKKHHIDTSAVTVRKGKRTCFDLVLSDRETMGRSLVMDIGDTAYLAPDELNEEMIKEAAWLYICHFNDSVNKAIRIAKDNGVKIFIDADFYTEEQIQNIPSVDVFIASEFVYNEMFSEERRLDYEKNCRDVMESGPEIVLFTFGKAGCKGCSEEGYFEIPAYDVEVVDTVGAGDDFHGAFLAARIKGKSVKESARFASAVSAIKCTRIGGRAGIPDWKTTEKFMSTGQIDYDEIDQRVRDYERGL